MKEYDNQTQAFPKNAPSNLRSVQMYRIEGNGKIWVSDELAKQVKRFVPSCRPMPIHSSKFKQICVNWWVSQRKRDQEYASSRIPKKKGLTFMSEALFPWLIKHGVK